MISMLFALQALVGADSGHASDADVSSARRYDAVMREQYAAHSTPVAQQPEEAKRVYQGYLNSIGQKIGHGTQESTGNAEDQPH